MYNIFWRALYLIENSAKISVILLPCLTGSDLELDQGVSGGLPVQQPSQPNSKQVTVRQHRSLESLAVTIEIPGSAKLS